MAPKTFLATQPAGLTRASLETGRWQISRSLAGETLTCLAADPGRPHRVFAGTRGRGVLRSLDAGQTWQAAGLSGRFVKSLAVSPPQPNRLYAGTKPPALFVSEDGGETWNELAGFQRARAWWWRSPAEADLGAYVQAIALSPADANVILAGIEAGAVVRSADGGRSWERHRPGALRDCHTLIFHSAQGDWAYEAGGTGAGAAVSRDAGRSWRQPRAGLDRHSGWAAAADPAHPEVWYVSASPMSAGTWPPIPAAHVDGQARAAIFRSDGGAAWQKLGGGLPEPLNHMPYALLTDPAAPGHLYAGLSSGEVWHSADYGDSWQRLPLNLGAIHRTLLMF